MNFNNNIWIKCHKFVFITIYKNNCGIFYLLKSSFNLFLVFFFFFYAFWGFFFSLCNSILNNNAWGQSIQETSKCIFMLMEVSKINNKTELLWWLLLMNKLILPKTTLFKVGIIFKQYTKHGRVSTWYFFL